MTWVVSIANEKGGVAKTTTSLSLSGAFVESGYRVLAVDLDPQANLSLSLGQESKQTPHSIIDGLINNFPITDLIKKTSIENLDLIPSNSQLGLAERLLPSKQNYTLLLRNLFKSGNLPYDYVFIDCPPFLGAITSNALLASDLLKIGRASCRERV